MTFSFYFAKMDQLSKVTASVLVWLLIKYDTDEGSA